MTSKRLLAAGFGAAAFLAAGSASALTVDFGEYARLNGETAVESAGLNPLTVNGTRVMLKGYNWSGGALDPAPFAYLDGPYSGRDAGAGVCQRVNLRDQCRPGSDDNITGSNPLEVLGITFIDTDVNVTSVLLRDETHKVKKFGAGDWFETSIDGGVSWISRTLDKASPFNTVISGADTSDGKKSLQHLLIGTGGSLNVAQGQEILFRYGREQFYVNALEFEETNITDVPLPAPFLLLGASVGLLGAMRRRRARAA